MRTGSRDNVVKEGKAVPGLNARRVRWAALLAGIAAVALAPSARAVSPSVRAGTRATAEASVPSGDHSRVRMARRYRSVASMVMREPSISTRTPVRIGSVSSRPAAVVTWATASVNTSPATVPDDSGMAGRAG
jgi:hypothetical protein